MNLCREGCCFQDAVLEIVGTKTCLLEDRGCRDSVSRWWRSVFYVIFLSYTSDVSVTMTREFSLDESDQILVKVHLVEGMGNSSQKSKDESKKVEP